MRSYRDLVTVEIKILRRYLYLLNHVTFSRGVKCVFVFTKKFFCVARDDLNHVPMEVLGSKPLIIHLEYNKYVYMYTRIVIYDKVMMTLF